jgi:hypothetical protein
VKTLHDIPAGKFWCPRCFARTHFIVHPEASPEDPECALECWDCGYVHDKIVEECDPTTGIRHPNPRVRSAVSREQREQARAEIRENFRRDVIRDGARRENFSNGRRPSRG